MTRDVTIKPDVERMAREEPPSRLGSWWWVKGKAWWAEEHEERWLACVVREGSNYLRLESPFGGSARVHLDEMDDELTAEPNWRAVVDSEIARLRRKSNELMTQAHDICRSLGVNTRSSGSTALTAPAGHQALQRHKKALVVAETESLPAIFKQISDVNEKIGKWMAADVLPLDGQLDTAKELIGKIKGRVHAIQLYAGVTESIVQCKDGEPAGADERVRLMQRRLYMDEECLLDYRAGGMEFKDIDRFDRWLCRKGNRDRIMPFPKCVVSMRVRRTDKTRDAPNFLRMFINIQLGDLDEATFLYVRNGERVYRIATDIDFDEKLFPDRASFDPQRPMMAKMFASRVDELIDRREYEELAAAEEERDRKYKQWMRDNPASSWNEEDGSRDWSNPYRDNDRFSSRDYEPFDPSSVFYDEIAQEVSDRITHYNRVALIVQGLFDRSDVFRPHNAPRVWRNDDFMRAVELVYDASQVLAHGDAPDFEAYRAELNASLGVGSITVGQHDYWMRREARRENERASRSRMSGRYQPMTTYWPDGDPGPGFASPIADWKPGAKIATFRWTRGRRRSTWRARFGDPVDGAVTVPATALLNVSAYKPGDYRRFYLDSRTRAEYLKWAPFLLGAENYHGGKS